MMFYTLVGRKSRSQELWRLDLFSHARSAVAFDHNGGTARGGCQRSAGAISRCQMMLAVMIPPAKETRPNHTDPTANRMCRFF